MAVRSTAGPRRARACRERIAEGGKTEEQAVRVVAWNGAAIIGAARGERWANGAGTDEAVLVVQEVHTLSEAEQAALLLLYDNEKVGRRRIIATSSISLFDRVKEGTFSASLFYRLNTIHVVGKSSGDGARAAERVAPPN